jgi:exopolysaccharide biosynthesis polyprenyl glycosylphosphotransferase
MKQRSADRFVLFMFLGDGLVLFGAFLLAYWLRIHLQVRSLLPIHSLNNYLPAALVVIGLALVMFVFYGLYDLRRRLSMLSDATRLIKAVTLSLVLALMFTFFFKYYERSRTLAAIFWLTAVAAELLYRWGVTQLIKARRRRGWDALHVLVLGVDSRGPAVEKMLQRFPELGYRTAGTLHLDPARELASRGKGGATAALARKLAKVMAKHRVDGLVLTFPIKYYEQMVAIVGWCEEKGLEVHYITSAVDILTSRAIQEELQESLAFDTLQDAGNLWRDISKRLLDEVLSLLFLVLTLPVWLAIALAIKLDSPGPVLFRQERVGKLGRHFTIYKFRTMFVHAPKYAVTPRAKGDPRVTRVGAFLRQASLDELPQFLNVIKGDMSLVGPRPEQPFMVERYDRPIYHRRHLVLPGLTGLWQVSGRSDKPLEENIKYDLYYIKHRSLLFDLLILARTLPAVFSKKGAY